MANSFQQAQQEALALIKQIESEVSKLDAQLVGVASNISKTLKGVSGSANMQSQLAGFNAEMERLNKIVSQQQSQIQNLTQAKISYNNANKADTNEIKSKIPTLRQLAKAQNSLGNAYTVLVDKQKKARDEVRRLTVEQGKNSRETKRAQREYNKLSKQVDRANKSTQSFSRKGLASVGRGFTNLLSAFGIVGGIQIFRTLVKDVFELTKTFDGLSFALERVAGDMEAAADSQMFLQDISQKFGVELIATTQRWIKFLAAAKQSGITLKDTEDIFRTMAKVSGVLGLKTDELTGIYLALEQMLSKGKVTTEELRRQLGERLPGAMGIMAQAVGVTVSKLDEMLKKGEVLSAEVLPKFAKAVELAYSLDSVENIQTLVAEQNRLTTAWQTFVKNVTEGDSTIKEVFGFMLITLREMVNLANDFFGGKSVSLQKEIIAASDLLKSNLDEMAEKELMLEGFALRRQLKEQKANIETLKIKKGVSKESITQAEEEYRIILDKLQKHEAEKESIIKEYAKDNAEQSKAEFDEQTRIYEDFLDKERKLTEEFEGDTSLFNYKFDKDRLKQIFGSEEINGIIIDSEEAFNKAFESVEANLGDATARWRLFKKLIEETNVVLPSEDEDRSEGDKKKRDKIKALDLEAESVNSLTKEVKDLIKFYKEAIEITPEMTQEFFWLEKQIENLESVLTGLDVSEGMKDIEEWSKNFTKKQEEARQEAIKLAEALDDYFKKFEDNFFSQAGFDFLGELVTDFDKFKKLLEGSEDDWAVYATSVMEIGQEMFNFLNQNQDAYFQNQLFRLEQERDIAIAFAGDSATARDEINRQYEERRREIQQKQAESDRNIALFNIAIDTAQAVVASFIRDPSGISAAIIGAIGAAQLALVASQPLPEFFRGTMNAPEGWAMVDEKRPEIHTDNKGNIKSFGESKANMRYLDRGDKIYTSRESYFQKELGGILEGNDILPYNQMFDMVAPTINLESGLKKDDFIREIRGMRNDIMKKETSIININKSGFTSSVIKGSATKHKQNNILTLRGGVV